MAGSVRDLLAIAKALGFKVSRDGKHMIFRHGTTMGQVTLSKSPSDYDGFANAVAELRRQAGLSHQGRTAVVGKRRAKKRKAPQRGNTDAPAAEEVSTRERGLSSLDRLMRQPWS